MNRLAEIAARKVEIRALLESENKIELGAIEQELRALETEEAEIKKRQEIANNILKGTTQVRTIDTTSESAKTKDVQDVISTPEYRKAYLKHIMGKDLTQEEQRTLTTAPGSAGAAVPTTTRERIIDRLRQSSALFPYITVTYTPGNVRFVVANAKNDAAWKAEGVDGTALDDTVTEVILTGFELIKLVEISAAASAMAIDAFEDYITAEIGRRMAIAIENAIISGTGVGQPSGIIQTGTWVNGTNQISWGAGEVTYDAVADALALLPTMYHQNAVFAMSRATLFGGIKKVKGTDGHPIFVYNAQDKPAARILGYPVVLNDYVPANRILICNPSYYYMNFSQAPSIEVSREAAFRAGKITYRGLAVVDGKPAHSEAFVLMRRT